MLLDISIYAHRARLKGHACGVEAVERRLEFEYIIMECRNKVNTQGLKFEYMMRV